MSTGAIRVTTKTLILQGHETHRHLEAPANAESVQSLIRNGLNVPTYTVELKDATDELQQAEAEQERLKTDYLREVKEDEVVAREGYRWALRLQAMARGKIARDEGADPLDLRGRLRFGKIKDDRPRTIAFELFMLLPEAREFQSQLSEHGVDAAFVQEGERLLSELGGELKETADVVAARKEATRRVRVGEKNLSRLLRQLEAVDEAAALEHENGRAAFGLYLVRAEQRQKAEAYEARLALRKQQSAEG